MRLFSIILSCVAFITACKPYRYVVAKEGRARFRSVQAALDAVPEGSSGRTVIHIKPGIYKEVIAVDSRKNNITLKGSGNTVTILTFDNHAGTRLPNGDTINTWTSASFFVYGNDFRAEDITFSNNAGFKAGQAVALRVEGDRASFFNCAMTGFQDVLFLSGSGTKQYFNHCYIEGTTDFIFGAATAWFDSCHIHSKKNSHVTAASTNSIIPYGFVFNHCRLTADSGIDKVSLGRPWSPTASVTYLNCFLGKHIVPEGWNNWKNPANESTARFSEYGSTGPGAAQSLRAKWSRMLTDDEAGRINYKNVLGTWEPFKKNYEEK